MASNNRPEKIKSVPQAAPFQNGGVTHATKCSTPELLHGQGGSERRLSNSSSVSRVPLSLRLSRRQRTVVTVSNPSIWTLHCSICLFKDNKASSSILTSSRHPYYHLPGRHVVSVTNGELTSAGSVNSLWFFSSLGFLINIPKTTVVPSSEIEFLGFTVNTKTMTVALPTIKRSRIQSEVARVLQNKTIHLKVLSQLLDKLAATKPAAFRAPLHYRALQHLKISIMRAGQEVATIPTEAEKDLTWWHTQLPMHPCSPIVQKEASVVIESDASLKGWGANCKGVRTSGVWNMSEAQCHINLLELRAAYLAIQCFLKGRSGVNVLLRLDNRTAIAYLNHMGGASMTPLCCLALEI